ncbi:MAG TPA: DUF1987 domain-containing protein [Alphaproteobacteria bacterium]|nr:DUF1987 domain-containing protein [Alphaproteobacteria bacterium]
MSLLAIKATDRSPEIRFDFASHRLLLKGEAYPENAAEFFGPLQRRLDAYLGALAAGTAVTFDIELIYFNSSSAKALMNLFDSLDAAAGRGLAVTVHWRYPEGDPSLREFGEEFGEDLANLRFELVGV